MVNDMEKKFELKSKIKEYTSQITSDIMISSTRKKVQQEYAEHIEDCIYKYVLSGMSEMDAFRKVCDDMGDVGKIRFLLSQVHNNKIQMFLILNFFNPLRKAVSGKNFLKFSLIFLVCAIIITVLCLSNLPSLTLYFERWGRLLETWWFQKQVSWYAMILVLLFVLILFGKLIFSVFCYIIGKIKIYCYFALISICNGYKMRITRLPFASLRKMQGCGDIKICAKEKTYRIHFIDVVMKYRRIITVLNNETYAVSKVLPDELGVYGATLVDGESFYNLYVSAIKSHSLWGNKIKKFPRIEKNDRDIHIILICHPPISQNIIQKNSLKTLLDGEKLESYTYNSVKTFSKSLKQRK